MIKNLIMAVIVILFAIGVTVFLDQGFKTNKGDFFILEKGKNIPDFSFKTLDGKTYNFKDFKGKTVIVHFWASWCAPCIVEFPELIKLALKSPSTVILAFSSDSNIQAIENFLKKNKMIIPKNLMIVHDKGKIITNQKFSVFRLPESFVFDTDLKLESHIIGAYTGWSKN